MLIRPRDVSMIFFSGGDFIGGWGVYKKKYRINWFILVIYWFKLVLIGYILVIFIFLYTYRKLVYIHFCYVFTSRINISEGILQKFTRGTSKVCIRHTLLKKKWSYLKYLENFGENSFSSDKGLSYTNLIPSKLANI